MLRKVIDKFILSIKINMDQEALWRWQFVNQKMKKIEQLNALREIMKKKKERDLVSSLHKLKWQTTEDRLIPLRGRLTPADKRDVLMKVVRKMIITGRVNLEQRGLWKWYIKAIDFYPYAPQPSNLQLNATETLHRTIMKNICRRVNYREFQAKKRCFNSWRDPDGQILAQVVRRTATNPGELRANKKLLDKEKSEKLVKGLERLGNLRQNFGKQVIWKWYLHTFLQKTRQDSIKKILLKLKLLRLGKKESFSTWRLSSITKTEEIFEEEKIVTTKPKLIGKQKQVKVRSGRNQGQEVAAINLSNLIKKRISSTMNNMRMASEANDKRKAMIRKTLQNLALIAKQHLRKGFEEWKLNAKERELETSKRSDKNQIMKKSLKNLAHIAKEMMQKRFNDWKLYYKVETNDEFYGEKIKDNRKMTVKSSIRNLSHIAKEKVQSGFNIWRAHRDEENSNKENAIKKALKNLSHVIKNTLQKSFTMWENAAGIEITKTKENLTRKSLQNLAHIFKEGLQNDLFNWKLFVAIKVNRALSKTRVGMTVKSFGGIQKVAVQPYEEYENDEIFVKRFSSVVRPAILLEETAQKRQTAYNPITRVLSVPVFDYEYKRTMTAVDNKPLISLEIIDENKEISRKILNLEWEQKVINKLRVGKNSPLHRVTRPILMPEIKHSVHTQSSSYKLLSKPSVHIEMLNFNKNRSKSAINNLSAYARLSLQKLFDNWKQATVLASDETYKKILADRFSAETDKFNEGSMGKLVRKMAQISDIRNKFRQNALYRWLKFANKDKYSSLAIKTLSSAISERNRTTLKKAFEKLIPEDTTSLNLSKKLHLNVLNKIAMFSLFKAFGIWKQNIVEFEEIEEFVTTTKASQERKVFLLKSKVFSVPYIDFEEPVIERQRFRIVNKPLIQPEIVDFLNTFTKACLGNLKHMSRIKTRQAFNTWKESTDFENDEILSAAVADFNKG